MGEQTQTQTLALARRNGYAVIPMDMPMLHCTGLQAAPAIRADSLRRSTPIISTPVMAEDRRSGLEAGMNGPIGKPINPDVPLKPVPRWLGANESVAPIQTEQSHD